jgi:hypothetical protein
MLLDDTRSDASTITEQEAIIHGHAHLGAAPEELSGGRQFVVCVQLARVQVGALCFVVERGSKERRTARRKRVVVGFGGPRGDDSASQRASMPPRWWTMLALRPSSDDFVSFRRSGTLVDLDSDSHPYAIVRFRGEGDMMTSSDIFLYAHSDGSASFMVNETAAPLCRVMPLPLTSGTAARVTFSGGDGDSDFGLQLTAVVARSGGASGAGTTAGKRARSTQAVAPALTALAPSARKARREPSVEEVSQLTPEVQCERTVVVTVGVRLTDREVQQAAKAGLHIAAQPCEWSQCRIIVAEAPLQRSIKLLAALPSAECIVGRQWLDSAMKLGVTRLPTSPADRQLYGFRESRTRSSLEYKHGFSIVDHFARPQELRRALFQGTTFFVASEVTPQDAASGNDIRIALRNSGATIVDTRETANVIVAPTRTESSSTSVTPEDVYVAILRQAPFQAEGPVLTDRLPHAARPRTSKYNS